MAIREVLGDQFIKYEHVVHGFAYNFAPARDLYAFLPVKCSGFGRTRDDSVHFFRFSCLFPHCVLA